MINKFCEEFKKSSEYINRWLNNQNAVGEESITDWLLFNLSQKLPELSYIKFTRHQEARITGADWEWWIVGDKSSLHLRIQAKRIKHGVDNYPGLAYKNNHGSQIDKLIKDAKSKNYLPFYALYALPKINQKVLCAGQSNSAYLQGVFLASAETINNKFILKNKAKVDADDVLSYSNPLHCIFCCPMSFLNGSVSFYEYISRYFPEAIGEKNSNINSKSRLGINDKAPNYVISLLQYKDEGVPDWWENEFRDQVDDVASLVVLDIRKN